MSIRVSEDDIPDPVDIQTIHIWCGLSGIYSYGLTMLSVGVFIWSDFHTAQVSMIETLGKDIVLYVLENYQTERMIKITGKYLRYSLVF